MSPTMSPTPLPAGENPPAPPPPPPPPPPMTAPNTETPAEMLDRWRHLRELEDASQPSRPGDIVAGAPPPAGWIGTRERVLLDVVDRVLALERGPADDSPNMTDRILASLSARLDLLEHRLGLQPGDKMPDAIETVGQTVTSLQRALEDLNAATTAAIADNADRIIALESKIADR